MFCQKKEKIGEILKNLRVNDNVKEFFKETEQFYYEVTESFLRKDFDLAYGL